MMILFLALAAAVQGVPVTPIVNDGAVIRCAIGRLTPQERARLQAGVLASVGGARPTPVTEALRAQLRLHAAACETRGGNADARAGELALASVAVETLATAIGAKGGNVAAINARLQATSRTAPATLDALLAGKREPRVTTFGEGVIAAAGGEASDAMKTLVGGYTVNAARLAKLLAARPR